MHLWCRFSSSIMKKLTQISSWWWASLSWTCLQSSSSGKSGLPHPWQRLFHHYWWQGFRPCGQVHQRKMLFCSILSHRWLNPTQVPQRRRVWLGTPKLEIATMESRLLQLHWPKQPAGRWNNISFKKSSPLLEFWFPPLPHAHERYEDENVIARHSLPPPGSACDRRDARW